jgi:hypothetical protein
MPKKKIHYVRVPVLYDEVLYEVGCCALYSTCTVSTGTNNTGIHIVSHDLPVLNFVPM